MIAVYKKNGPHFGPPGIKYDCKGVPPEQLEEAKKQGWHEDFLVAIGLKEEETAPTREEMLQQAEKLSIKVDGRWSDARLLSEIDAAMKGQQNGN